MRTSTLIGARLMSRECQVCRAQSPVRPVNLSLVLRDRSGTVEMDDDDDTLTDYEKQREANIQRELVCSDTHVSAC